MDKVPGFIEYPSKCLKRIHEVRLNKHINREFFFLINLDLGEKKRTYNTGKYSIETQILQPVAFFPLHLIHHTQHKTLRIGKNI